MRKLINLLLLLVCNAALAQQPNVKLIKSEFIFHNAPFKACHASTLALLNNGNLMAAWFGGSNEGNADVCIWSAIKKGNQWSKPVKSLMAFLKANNTHAGTQFYLKPKRVY